MGEGIYRGPTLPSEGLPTYYTPPPPPEQDIGLPSADKPSRQTNRVPTISICDLFAADNEKDTGRRSSILNPAFMQSLNDFFPPYLQTKIHGRMIHEPGTTPFTRKENVMVKFDRGMSSIQ